ncbi:MAG: CocE/NonD family hydrolase [Acidobacteria bacterium]|nr:CocE/NonD family hydrolase [Acidobacteriota bacterium]
MKQRPLMQWLPKCGWLLACLLLAGTGFSQPVGIRQEKTSVAMADGVTLVTQLYLPAQEGKHPTILIRTPYNNSASDLSGYGKAFAEAGYSVVVQLVRGRGGSGGAFLPFAAELSDGVATLDWIVKQPWSSGKVGVWGPSYLGHCGLLLAGSGHPAVAAGVNISGWADLQTFLRTGDPFVWLTI